MLYNLQFFFYILDDKKHLIPKTKKKKENRHIDDLQCSSYCVPTRGSPTRRTSVVEELLLEIRFLVTAGEKDR